MCLSIKRRNQYLTLEYAYDDYCMAQAAKALGKEDDYRYFLNRALLSDFD